MITPASLLGELPDTEEYSVKSLSYTAELVDEGLLVERSDVSIPLDADQQPWVRSVQALEAGGA